MYYVYILYSKIINQIYVGFTYNLKNRLTWHKKHPTRTTKRASDYKLIWYSSFINRKFAENFEIYLKSHSGRAFTRKHILGDLTKTIDHKRI